MKISPLAIRLFSLFVLLYAGSLQSAPAKIHNLFFSVDPSGKICDKFWEYSPWIRAEKTNLKAIRSKADLLPLIREFSAIKNLDRYLDNADPNLVSDPPRKKVLALAHRLDKLGFETTMKIQTSFLPLNFVETKEGYLWTLHYSGASGLLNLYFIPKSDTHLAIPVFIRYSLRLNELRTENMGKDKVRVLYTFSGTIGRMGSQTFSDIRDLDLKKGTGIEYGFHMHSGGRLVDLDHDGRMEIVLFQEIFYELVWFWIFSWDGDHWVDVSRKYPDYYRIIGPKIVDFWECVPNIKSSLPEDGPYAERALAALLKAASLGGPSAYEIPKSPLDCGKNWAYR